ncbi:MAG TPA: ABC transporter permease [Ktedonobacterales bacterium]|nr:ABC transporter permease [Ktedonobacterales bacterium]
MTLQEPVAQPDVSPNVLTRAKPRALPAFPNFLVKTLDIAEWEIRKLRHDPTDLFTRAVQPALWLVIFGEVFTRIRAIPTGQVRYLDFLAPGILAQSVLFISIFYGIAIIWERDLGVIHKFLASPIPRATIVLGKAASAGIRALPQALIIYLLALVLGVQMNWNPLAILGVVLLVMLGAACFSTFSMIIACLLRTRDRVMGIGQVLTMPLFFASNAIYPIQIMPGWLQVIAHGNPLTYVVDGIRMLMLTGTAIDFSSLGVDILVLAAITTILVSICAALYPRIVQ